MTPQQIKEFIEGLKKAREAVVNGSTGCYGRPHCWHCAMRHHSGIARFRIQDPKTGLVPDNSWGWDSKELTVAMFDNSIAALVKEYHELEDAAMARENLGTHG